MLMGRGQNGVALLSCQSGELTVATLQEALSEEQIITLLGSPASFTLFVSELSACQMAQYSCVLSQGHSCF